MWKHSGLVTTFSNMKLRYFNLRARAELIRLILAYTETDYEDWRIEMDDLGPQTKQGEREIHLTILNNYENP